MKLRIPEIVLGALLAIAIFAMGMLFASSSKYPDAPQQNHAAQTSETKSHKDLTDERLADYTLLLAWFTGVLAVSTVGLWIVTWLGGRKQARDMQASIKVGQDAAIAAADAADAAINLHRPWVTVELEPTTTILEDANLNLRTTFNIRMLNVGATPATRVQVQLTIGAGLARFDRARERLRPREGSHGRTLFPNVPSNRRIWVHVRKTEVFNPEDLQRISSPDGTMAWMSVVVFAEYDFPGGVGTTTKVYQLYTGHDEGHLHAAVCVDVVPVQIYAREYEEFGAAT